MVLDGIHKQGSVQMLVSHHFLTFIQLRNKIYMLYVAIVFYIIYF